MKIIGITGESGAGKTTFSNLLAEQNNAKVIHLDYIMGKIKNKRAFKIITSDTEETKEQDCKRVMKKNLSDFIYNTKIILKIYLILRNKLKGQILKNIINEEEKNGTALLIIEGFDLQNFNIMKNLDLFILVTVPYHVRMNRLSKREDIPDKRIVVVREDYLQRVFTRKSRREYTPDYKIENDRSIDFLRKKCDEILKELYKPSPSKSKKFREKYIATKTFNGPRNKTSENNPEPNKSFRFR